MADYIQVSSTVDSEDAAHTLAGAVVGERLAASAQVIGPISSIYSWNGQLETAEEWLVLFKSRSDLFAELSALVQQLHPYDRPEVVAVPITAGARSYLDWMNGQLKRPRADS